MPNTNRKYLENKELLKNPKIRAMLDVIGTAEGATYNTRVGGATFDDLSKKPGKSTYIPSIKQNSTAEGRYQFLNSTWGGVAKDLGISDFSPESQDIAAIELIKRRGALNDILTDNFDNAIYKLSPEWASLPTPTGKGYYAGQKAKNINKLRSIFSGASSATPTEYDIKEVKPQYQETQGFLTVNQGEQQTAGEWTEPKEVSEAKTQLIQAQNEENFIKEFQAIGAQQEEIQQEQPNYLQSQELFTLAPTEQIQYNTPQEFQRGGISQFKKKPFQLKSEVNQVKREATNISKQQARPLQQLNVRNKTDKEIAQEREQRIQASVEAQKVPYTKENWRQQLANETLATGDKLRVSLEPNFFDDYLNPAAMVGNMASNLGKAPLQAQQSDSNLPYITAIGAPLVTGALAGIGTKTTGQFVNNVGNPLAGTGDLLKNINNPINIVRDISAKNKVLKLAKENKDFFNSEIGKERLRDIGINPSDLEYPSITFKKQGSGYFDKNINIDLKQIRDIKKEGLMSSPSSVYDHENAHWLQEQKGKNTDEYQNALLNHQREIDKYDDKVEWYKENNYVQGDPPQKPNVGSVNADYKTNVDYYLHEKFNTLDENKILSRIKEQGVKNPDDIRYHNALHFTDKQEPFAYIREFRRDLIDKKYIKNISDPITEETIKNFIKKEPKARMSSIIGGDDNLVKAVKNVINGIPAIAPIAGAAYLTTQGESEFQQGGIINDNRGQWEYPGEITQINSPSITMKNVPYPVLGIADTGEQIMMYPNGEYYFEGAKTITEYPQVTDKEKANLKAKSKHKNKRFSK